MKKLLVYLKDYKKESVLAPLFKLLEAFFELLVPLVMASIIDRGISRGDMGYIFRMGACLLALGAVGLVSSVTAQFFAAKAAVGFSTKLRQALFDHIQSLDFTNIDKAGPATMITRMTSDINQVQSGVNMVLRLFLRSPIIVLGAMIMAFTIDVKSALIFVVAIPLLAVVVFGIMMYTIPLYRKVQAGLDRVLGITRENLTGVRVIRAFHQEEKEEERFREENRALSSMQMFVGRISAFMNPVTYVIVNGAIIALIYTGAVQVNTGNLTQGQVIAIVNYMSQILVELIKLANLIITITKALACADRVQAVFEISNESEGAARPAVAHGSFLEFDHVSLTYRGAGAETLHDLNFSVERGETVGVIGGTGSGKSSLVNLIPNFYPVTSGAVRLNGVDIRELPQEELRRKVGFVPQKAVLFKGTVRSNLQWGKEDATEAEMWEAIDMAQAREVVEGKPGGLDAEISQNGKNLSGGQKQRLTIARALVRRPEILILDDSASALDYATDAKLRSALKQVEGRITTFIVSQRASSIRQADKIIVLDDGEIAGIGSHEQLLEECGVYREIYYSQYPKERKGTAGMDRDGTPAASNSVGRAGEPAASNGVGLAGDSAASNDIGRAGEPAASNSVGRAGDPAVSDSPGSAGDAAALNGGNKGGEPG